MSQDPPLPHCHDPQMQQNEDTIKQQQNEIEDLKRKLRLKDEAEAKVPPPTCLRAPKSVHDAA